jgi:hypothetical protein
MYSVLTNCRSPSFFRDILQNREEWKPVPDDIEQPAPTEQSPEPEPEPEPEPVIVQADDVVVESTVEQAAAAEVVERPPPTVAPVVKKDLVNIFYKDGQDLDKCLIANRYKI